MFQLTDLFDTSNNSGVLHPAFTNLKNSSAHKGARDLMNSTFFEMGDPDGNFAEQFQTNGFHSRIFELCCYNFLIDEDLNVGRTNSIDFIVTHPEGSFCLEATTSNPKEGSYSDISVASIRDLSEEELQEKIDNEIPIKLGSALFSKLKKRYWELEECKNLPLILAIGPFHEAGSMFYSDSSLAGYLYGIKQFPTWTENGELVIKETKINSHTLGKKTIPSFFFGQPDTENISAVLYSNSFTVPKFLRMSIQGGENIDAISIIREGLCYNPDPNSATPIPFAYDVRDPEAPYETWGQGASLFLNPNAKFGIPEDLFQTIQTHSYDGKNVTSTTPAGFYPIVSLTKIFVRPAK